LFLLSTVAAVLAGVISLLLPKTYRVEVRLLPTVQSSTGSSLASLVAGTGFGELFGGGFGTFENPIFTYPEIIMSRDVVENTLARNFASEKPGPSKSVSEALGAGGTTYRDRLHDGSKRLRDALSVSADPRSGIISVSVVTTDSLLSSFIAEAVLDELSKFNLQSHRTRGQAIREFLEGRLKEAEKDLINAESALTQFRNANMRIGNSPALQLQLDRRQREVEMKADLYRLLARQFELARIEERRDMPTFTLIQGPAPPLRKYRPMVLLNMLLAAVAAAALKLAWDYLGPTFRQRVSREG
jgi:tyrosine-protein kinase Etk/Wzc